MHDEIVLAALRAQAWQRAKGELNAMLEAHHSPNNLKTKRQIDEHETRFATIRELVEHETRFAAIRELVFRFIEEFEDQGYTES